MANENILCPYWRPVSAENMPSVSSHITATAESLTMMVWFWKRTRAMQSVGTKGRKTKRPYQLLVVALMTTVFVAVWFAVLSDSIAEQRKIV